MPSSIRRQALVGLFSTISDLVHSKERNPIWISAGWDALKRESVFLHNLKDHENPNKVRRIATHFLSQNGKTDVQNKSRKKCEERQRKEEDDENVEGHIDSRQDDDDDNNDDDEDEEHQIKDGEHLSSGEMFPHEADERYTQYLHVSTKGAGETIQTTTNSETEINPSCVLHVNQEQPPLDSDITAGICFAHRKDYEKAGTTHCRLNLASQSRLFWATQKK